MEICRTKAELRQFRARCEGRVGLVPTMGYLHDGHMALVQAAQAAADTVIASLFVNPTQFGDPADLAAYPRDTDRDLALLAAKGVDAVFLPEVSEIYGPEDETVVETTRLASVLMGALRPGHFRGVTTVVARLFNIVQPHVACFGEKDYQQLLVIRRMVRDLAFPVEIIGVPTVREADGLAMSSRNARLNPQDRQAATVLGRTLAAAQEKGRSAPDAETLVAFMRDMLGREPRADVQSVDLCDAQSLTPCTGKLATPAVALLAVRFGDVLLIDQATISPAPPEGATR